jgi:hypothetical protein
MQQLPIMEPSPEAIFFAAKTGRLEVIKRIFENKPELLANSNFQSAADIGGFPEIVEFLKENVPNPKTIAIRLRNQQYKESEFPGWHDNCILPSASSSEEGDQEFPDGSIDGREYKRHYHRRY